MFSSSRKAAQIAKLENAMDGAEPKAEVQQTSAVNGVVVDVNELSAAVATINRYKTAFGDHMQFREVGGRLKVQIAIDPESK